MAKLKRKTKHSPAGTLYKQLGDKKLTKLYRTKRRMKKLSGRITALNKATSHRKGTTATYVPSSLLGFAAWQKETGRGTTTTAMRAYRQYKRNFGK